MENHTEERIKMLEQAGTPEEVIRFLSELEAPILYEWSFLCAMEGMSVKELKRIYNAAEKQRAQASELFMRERERFLQAAYENNQGLWKEVQDLLTQVRIMYERASALEEGLNGKLTEAMQTKDKAFGEMIQTKDKMIRDHEGRITDLKKEISEWKKEISDLKKEITDLKKENRDLQQKYEGEREKAYSLEERLKTAEIRHSPAAKDNSSPDPGEGKQRIPADDPGSGAKGKGTEASQTSEDKVRVFPYNRYGYSVKRHRGWHSFFNRADREADEFIRLYIENKDYSEDQKQYLIECLEQGDSLSVIRKFASPNLSVKYMDQLRRILYERGY